MLINFVRQPREKDSKYIKGRENSEKVDAVAILIFRHSFALDNSTTMMLYDNNMCEQRIDSFIPRRVGR
jgi:hypothetical protein